MKRRVVEADLEFEWNCEGCGRALAVGDVVEGREMSQNVYGYFRCEACVGSGRPVVERGLHARTRVDVTGTWNRDNKPGVYVIKSRVPTFK